MMSRDSCLCFATVRADETWMFRSGGRAQPVDSVVVGAAHAILCINMQDVCQVWAVQYGQGGGDDWCSSPTARLTDWLSPLDDVPLYNKEPRWWRWRRRRRRRGENLISLSFQLDTLVSVQICASVGWLSARLSSRSCWFCWHLFSPVCSEGSQISSSFFLYNNYTRVITILFTLY